MHFATEQIALHCIAPIDHVDAQQRKGESGSVCDTAMPVVLQDGLLTEGTRKVMVGSSRRTIHL